MREFSIREYAGKPLEACTRLELFNAVLRLADDAARERLYRAIDERVHRAAPWLYLWFPVDLWAESPRISGWELPVIFNGQRWTGVRRTTPP